MTTIEEMFDLLTKVAVDRETREQFYGLRYMKHDDGCPVVGGCTCGCSVAKHNLDSLLWGCVRIHEILNRQAGAADQPTETP